MQPTLCWQRYAWLPLELDLTWRNDGVCFVSSNMASLERKSLTANKDIDMAIDPRDMVPYAFVVLINMPSGIVKSKNECNECRTSDSEHIVITCCVQYEVFLEQ